MFQIKPQMRYVDKMVNKNVSQLNGITATEGVIEAYLFFLLYFLIWLIFEYYILVMFIFLSYLTAT